MKNIVFAFLVTLFPSLLSGTPLQPVPLKLAEAEQLFLENNLLLLAEQYAVEIAEAGIIQARLFENPVISVDHNVYNRLSGRYFDVGPQGQTEVEIEQLIRLAGRRRKQISAEKVNKEIAVYQLEETVRELRSGLRETFITLYYALRSSAILDKEILSVSRLVDIYTVQQGKGNVSLLELSRLQALLITLKKERNSLSEEVRSLQHDLCLLTGTVAPVSFEPELDEADWLAKEPAHFSYGVFSAFIDERPDIRMAEAQVRLSDRTISLERSQAYPEFSVRGIYDRAGGIYDNYFALGVTLSVPLFNRNQGAIKAARLAKMQQTCLLQYARQEADKELLSAWQKYEHALRLYRQTDPSLLDNFEQILAAAEDHFIKRNISLLEFIDYYESCKASCLQIYEIRQDLLLAKEALMHITNSFNSPFEP